MLCERKIPCHCGSWQGGKVRTDWKLCKITMGQKGCAITLEKWRLQVREIFFWSRPLQRTCPGSPAWAFVLEAFVCALSGAKTSAPGNATSGTGCSLRGFLNKQLCNWKSWALLALGLKVLQVERLTEICPSLRQQTQRGCVEVERGNLEETQEKITFEEAGAKAFKKSHRHQVPHSKKQRRETEMAAGKLRMHPCAGHRGGLYSTLYWYCKRGKKDLQS